MESSWALEKKKRKGRRHEEHNVICHEAKKRKGERGREKGEVIEVLPQVSARGEKGKKRERSRLPQFVNFG